MFLTNPFSTRKRGVSPAVLCALGVATFAPLAGAAAHPLLPDVSVVVPFVVAQAGTEADADAAFAAGDYNRAIGVYDKLVAATPKKFKLYLSRGLAYFKARQFDKAAADFSQFVTLRPNLVEGYRNRAYANKELNKPVEGLADLDKAVSLDAKAEDPRLRGDLQLQKKDYAGAIVSYSKVRGALGGFLAGDVYAAQGNYAQAIASYTTGLTADPKSAYGYGQRGNAYIEDKKFALAAKDFTQYIAIAPADPFGYIQRGIANLQVGTPAGYTAAKADFQKYLTLEKRPDATVPATRYLAIAQKESGDLTGAVASYTTVINANNKDGGSLFSRGMVYMSLKDYPNAIKDFNTYATAFASGPSAGDAAYNLGSAYLLTTDYPKAIPAFTAALRVDPKDAAAYYGRLVAYLQTKQYDKAVADADMVYANTKDPKSEAVIDTYKLQALSYAELAKQGDKAAAAKAISTIAKYVTLSKDPNASKIQNSIVSEVGDPATRVATYTASIARTTAPKELFDLYFDRGTVYAQTKEYTKAVADYTKASTLVPTDKEVFVYLARTQVDQGNKQPDVDGAIASYTKAIALNADKPELLAERADQYVTKKDYAKADADLAAYATKAGSAVLAPTLLTHAQIKRALGKTDDAIAMYLKHLSLEKDEVNRATSMKQLGSLYSQKSDFANAIKAYSDYLSKNGKDAGVLVLRAEAYRKSDDTDKAMADANAALAVEPNNPVALTERGLINNKIGDKVGDADPDKAAAAWDASIADCDKAIIANGKYTLAYYCKGFAAYKNASDKGKADPKYWDTALDAFNKFVAAAAPTDPLLASAKAAIADIKVKKAG